MSFHIKVKRTELMEALRCQQSVIDRKATQPIFSHVKLVAENNQLSIEGSDGNLILNYTITSKVELEGVVTLPAQIFYNLVRKANSEFLVLIQKDDLVIIEYSSGTFKLNILDATTFPKMPEVADNLIFSINALEFLEYIKMIKIAMATDDIRAYFNGIYMESDENEMRFVATDAHKLAMYSKKVKLAKFDMILSRKSVETLSSLLTKEETLECYKHEHHVKFVAKNFSFVCRLINGAFPANYMGLIPNSIEGTFEDTIDNLKESLDRISILSSQLSKVAKVQLGKESVIKCENVAYGSGEEKLSGQYEGPDFTFGIDCNIWLDFLRLFEQGNMKLEYHGTNKPIVMRHENYNNFVYIAMPIALNS